MADTPLHKLRAPKRLWQEFGEACEANGTDRSAVLRTYMRRYIAAWKGRRSHGTPSDGSNPNIASS